MTFVAGNKTKMLHVATLIEYAVLAPMIPILFNYSFLQGTTQLRHISYMK